MTSAQPNPTPVPTSEELQRPALAELQATLKALLNAERFDKLQEFLAQMHPAEIAALMTGLGAFERNLVFDLSPQDIQHEILTELEEGDQERLLDRLDDERISELFRELDSDDLADLAGLLDDSDRERILQNVPDEDREEVMQLLEYDEESAGGLMAVELVAVRDDQTVRDAVEAVRAANREDVEHINYVYVVDRLNVLKGGISLVDLMLAPRDQKLTALLDEDFIAIKEDEDQEEVAHIFQRYDLVTAPVVDSESRLVGRITVDDVIDVVQDEAEEDIGYLTGTGEEEVSERNLIVAARSRLPWLVIAFLGEIFGAFVVSGFAESLANLIVLTFFIPVVIAVAGNVGIQSSTIVVRGLATGEIAVHKFLSRIGREVLVSLLNGIVLVSIMIIVIFMWQHSWKLGMAMGISLLTVIVMAATVGTIVPFALKKLNLDPAMASGPFITMTNDVLGLFIYLIITSSILT